MLEVAAVLQIGKVRQVAGVGLVQHQACAAERGDLAHQSHMIGMDMGEQNRADIGPGDAYAFPRAVERIEARLGIHAGIDEHPAIAKPDEVDIDQAQGKRKR